MLLEGDRGVGSDGGVLPLVTCRRVERDIERVALCLPSGDGTEVPVARQAADRRKRRDATDADTELAQGSICILSMFSMVSMPFGVNRAARDRQAELHRRRDGPRVGDVERLVLHLARLQVTEVQVEGANAAQVVGQTDAQLGRGDVHLAGVTGAEVGSGGGCHHEPNGDSNYCDSCASEKGALGLGVQGH